MSMTVTNKNNNEKYEVYDISYDKAGYPRFLIYKNNQWVRMSAKHFKPHTFLDAMEEVNKSFKRFYKNEKA